MAWEQPVKKPGYQINLVLLIALIAIVCIGVPAGVYAVMQYQKSIPTNGVSGSIGIEVYADDLLTQVVDSIDWGTVAPASTVFKTIYIKNTGNLPVTLTFEANWPVAAQSQFFGYVDTYLGELIQPNDNLAFDVGVQAAADLSAVPTWGFDLIITATET